jgi:holo-[acyl-carrier protein] synthase
MTAEIIGTGIDIVELDRFQDALNRHPERFIRRILTEAERMLLAHLNEPAQHYAVRFAAKEAVFKALSVIIPDLGWHDVEILKHPDGRPFCRIHRPEFTGTVHISLSHGRDYAIAQAIATR